MPFDQAFVKARLRRSAEVVISLEAQAALIERIGHGVRGCLAAGGRIYTCGNGGSAAEAMHLTEELIGRYSRDRPPFGAICLNADPTALTCIANDYGFENIYARQVTGLGRKGDVLIVFSTSGNSRNLVLALETARRLGLTTIGLLGKGGGHCAAACDLALIVDAVETEHIQEAHQVVLHLILEAVEADMK